MKREVLIVLVVCGLVSAAVLDLAVAGKGKGSGGGNNPPPAPVLTEDEADDLLFMREEEKLARDVYDTLYIEWGLAVFDNISDSEQKHTDAVLGLIIKYGLDDPALGPGEFANAELQELYDLLIDAGTGPDSSLLDALMVGVLIEETDMEDIVNAMERTDEPDILNVYGNLLAGSENHLDAFLRNIEAITGAP